MLAVVAAGVLTVGGCAQTRNDGSGFPESLRNSLHVAEAALEAGQPAVARRLYLSLAEQFDDAPEPALGLAYVALYSGNFVAAEHHFLQAAERADDAQAAKAEALLGAGRAALARAETRLAREHFSKADELESGALSSAWISNGLAVAAALDGDYETAEEHYLQALRNSSDDPRIAANLIHLLIAAGRTDDAAKLHAERDESYWSDEDGRALAQLIEGARRGTRAVVPKFPTDGHRIRPVASNFLLEAAAGGTGRASAAVGSSAARQHRLGPARSNSREQHDGRGVGLRTVHDSGTG